MGLHKDKDIHPKIHGSGPSYCLSALMYLFLTGEEKKKKAIKKKGSSWLSVSDPYTAGDKVSVTCAVVLLIKNA